MSLAVLLAAGPGAIGPLLVPIILVILLVAVYRICVNGFSGRGRAHDSRTHDMAARRFRLTPMAGWGPVDCVMYGEPRGPGLRHGDLVTVAARRTRKGHYVVRQVEVMASPTGPVVGRVTARPGMRFRVARLAGRLSLVLSSLIVLWATVVLVGVLV
jgi:hypothetical protein